MRALEARSAKTMSGEAYSLDLNTLPFALTFAQRREVISMDQRPNCKATQSDGATTGNEGSGGDNENFDWLDDD